MSGLHVGMTLQKAHDLLCCDLLPERLLQTFPGKRTDHEVGKAVIFSHEQAKDSLVQFGVSVGVDLEVAFNDDELVLVVLLHAVGQ